MKPKYEFSDSEHRKQCKEAGCKHPAVYKAAGKLTVQGWCNLCRALAFGPKPKRVKDEPEQEKHPIEALKERLASRKPIGRNRIRIL
jgi:hypothetical protein